MIFDTKIVELKQDLQTTADALGHAIAQPEEGYPGITHDFEQAKLTIAKLQDLIEEQKGTITALNMALGGEDSTSIENLIDSHEVDYADEGLIALCRKLTQENVRLEDVVLCQKKAWTADFEELERLRDQLASAESSPITEEVEDILRSEIAKRDARIAELIKECERFRQEALCAYLDDEESIIAKQALRIKELEQARGICPKCACASDFTLTSPR